MLELETALVTNEFISLVKNVWPFSLEMISIKTLD